MDENKIMRILREANGYTQEYIASELGINQNTYSKLEAGQTRLTVDRVRKLAGIYKVDPDYFFSKDVSVINYNTGAHSHGGPIHTYNSYDNDAIKKLYEQLLNEKDEKISLLQIELEHKRQEIEKLVSLVEKLSNKI
jgi:transcriptional regulator with XRE-family HTH domain